MPEYMPVWGGLEMKKARLHPTKNNQISHKQTRKSQYKPVKVQNGFKTANKCNHQILSKAFSYNKCKLKKGEIKRIHFKLIHFGPEWLVVAAAIIRVRAGACFHKMVKKRKKKWDARETFSAGTEKYPNEKKYNRRTLISIHFCW